MTLTAQKVGVEFKNQHNCMLLCCAPGMGKMENIGNIKIEKHIRKDCFQVKSNLLTVDNLVFHF